jgi:hypothetical protein
MGEAVPMRPVRFRVLPPLPDNAPIVRSTVRRNFFYVEENPMPSADKEEEGLLLASPPPPPTPPRGRGATGGKVPNKKTSAPTATAETSHYDEPDSSDGDDGNAPVRA